MMPSLGDMDTQVLASMSWARKPQSTPDAPPTDAAAALGVNKSHPVATIAAAASAAVVPRRAHIVPLDEVVLEQSASRGVTARDEPPSWLGAVPAWVRIDVVKSGAEADRFDADDGLWSVVPPQVPPRLLPDGRPNTDQVAEYDALCGAVASGAAALRSQETRRILWDGVRRAVARRRVLRDARAAAVSAKKKSGAPPQDYGTDWVSIGKDRERCTIVVEHPSASRVHARVIVGCLLCKPPREATVAEIESSLGVYVEDCASANGTFVAFAAAETSSVTRNFNRVLEGVPAAVPATAHGAVFRIGASSREYTVSWQPLGGAATAEERAVTQGDSNTSLPAVRGALHAFDEPPTRAHRSEGVEGVSSVFDEVNSSLAGSSAEALESRKAKIEAALEQEFALQKRQETQEPSARFVALEKDLITVETALRRAQAVAAHQSSRGVRRSVIEEQ